MRDPHLLTCAGYDGPLGRYYAGVFQDGDLFIVCWTDDHDLPVEKWIYHGDFTEQFDALHEAHRIIEELVAGRKPHKNWDDVEAEISFRQIQALPSFGLF